MTMQMKVGIVGGQKRKTEAHLFKSLDEMGIEVAWHVEAMTNREFSRDCDAIVSMVDYIGHGLEARAKEFARLNNIPFRRITYNWSKAKPTFIELLEKFNSKHTESDMNKIIPPNHDWANAQDIANVVGYSTKSVRDAAERGEIQEFVHKSKDMREFKFYSISECKAFFKEKEENKKESLKLLAEQLLSDAGEIKQMVKAPAKLQNLMVCKVSNGFQPIIEIESLDDVQDAIALCGQPEGEYAVISVVKRFKAQVKVVIEEVK